MRTSAAAAFLLLLVCCCAPEAFACSCIPPRGGPTNVWHKDLLKVNFDYPEYASDTIFLGTVTKIEGDGSDEQNPEAALKVTFAVERVWANPRAGGGEIVATVWTRKHGSMCGFNFKEGGRYFVFARYGQASLCSPTAPYEDDIAADYYKALGEGREPERPKTAPRPPR